MSAEDKSSSHDVYRRIHEEIFDMFGDCSNEGQKDYYSLVVKLDLTELDLLKNKPIAKPSRRKSSFNND